MENNQGFNTIEFGQGPQQTVVNNNVNSTFGANNAVNNQSNQNLFQTQPINGQFGNVTIATVPDQNSNQTITLNAEDVVSNISVHDNVVDNITGTQIQQEQANKSVEGTSGYIAVEPTMEAPQANAATATTSQSNNTQTIPQEPIVQNSLKIETAKLSALLNNASKVAVDDQMVALTTIVQLIFSEEGFIIKATDTENYLTLIDKTHRFTKNVSLAVKIGLLKSLISKLDCEYVELVPDDSSNIISIYAGESVIKIPNEYDNSTGQAIIIQEPEQLKPTVTPVVFDYNYFRDMISKATAFGSSTSIQYNLSGVYISNYITATDKINMFAVENSQPALSSVSFYLTRKLAEVVKVLNIDSDAKIGYTYDADNNIRALTIESENIILTGPTDPTQDEFPVSDVINVINFPFTNSFKTDKDKLLNAMQVAELFIVPNSDKDSCNVEVNGTTNTMRVVNFNQQANLLLPIVGSTVPNASYKLNIQKVIAALKNIDSAEIEIFVSVNNSNIIKITDGTLNEVLSVTSFE